MNEQELTIKRDGIKLAAVLDSPTDRPFDLVIMMHGFTSNLGYSANSLFYQIAAKLNQKGLATLRFDFNGHGKSEGDLDQMTVWNEIADAKAVLNYARHLSNVRHIYLLGHSQGGVVASMLAGFYPDLIDGLALMSPAATLKDDALKGQCQGASYDPHHIPETVRVAGYDISGFYFRTAQQLPIYETAAHFEGPVCLIHGLADTVVDPEASRRYDAVYDNDQLHLLPGCDHSYLILPKRREAIAILIDFFSQLAV